jgi:23S rRNA G2445 N2-methylase RlmL
MDYTYSVVVERNCESLCLIELKNRFDLSGLIGGGFVDFSASDDVALKVAYLSQSAKRVLVKISSGSFSSLDDLSKKILLSLAEDSSFLDFLEDKYRVSCSRSGIHDFNSVLVEQEVSGLIKNFVFKKGLSVEADYNTNDLVFFLQIVDDNFLFGIDFAGKDLSKRHYLFFNNPMAIKGTVAFNLLLFSGFKPGLVLLDPFALAGVIPIEAALFERNLSVNFFSKDFLFPKKIRERCIELLKEFDSLSREDKHNSVFSCDSSFPNIASQKKNSRIAGVERNISFARVDTANLDIKNFSKDIDVVASRIIEPSKHVAESRAVRVYEELFVASSEFLSKKGSISVILRVPDLFLEVAKKHGFVLDSMLNTSQGQQELVFVRVVRK